MADQDKLPSAQVSALPEFQHPLYRLETAAGHVVRVGEAGLDHSHGDPTRSCEEEQQSLVEAISAYVRAYLKARFHLLEHWIPGDEAVARCDILLTPDWDTCSTLLVVLQNHVGSQIGIWSRGMCMSEGVHKGSMLSFLERAREGAGLGFILCNPNLNSVTVRTDDGRAIKTPIQDSSFPEEHTLYVYDNFVSQSQAQRVLLLGYGNGAILCKEMLQRQLALSSPEAPRSPRIAAVAMVEASAVILDDDSDDIKAFMSHLAVGWEASDTVPQGSAIPHASAKLGISQVLSLGSPPDAESHTTAWSMRMAEEAVFRYFSCVLDHEASQGHKTQHHHHQHHRPHQHGQDDHAHSKPHERYEELGYRFACEEATRFKLPPPLPPPASSSSSWPEGHRAVSAAGETYHHPRLPSNEGGFFSRLLKRLSGSSEGCIGGSQPQDDSQQPLPPPPPPPPPSVEKACKPRRGHHHHTKTGVGKLAMDDKIEIRDFDLLKVVGKGAFGKVMLVKKRKGPLAGQVYAMKVLKKSAIVNKGQVQHALCERAILCEIRHPFIVRLRFAFQNDHSLYLVTDYYSGGSLFVHLRKSGSFPEPRARFYAAELLLALQHLHEQFIVYRDLKLENVLMDAEGHIALTDFGLSKQGVHSAEGARTFCGTAEYIAPELLKGNPYGSAVDWWSFGILLYEMMNGCTPLLQQNRKFMFHCIINARPSFPPGFSLPAQSLVTALLDTDPVTRLGSSSRRGGAKEIMDQDFFRDVDWSKLLRKEVEPPYRPAVKGDTDTTFVPGNFTRLAAKESLSPANPDMNQAQGAFEQFTYMGDR